MKIIKLIMIVLCIGIYFCATTYAVDVNSQPTGSPDISISNKYYVGRYVLRTGLHPNDPFILNHLTRYNDQSINYENGQEPQYTWYDVYCDHDHTSDVDKLEQDYEVKKISFIGYIVPLNVLGKPMVGSADFNSNQSSIIVSEAAIMTKGTWSFEPQNLKVYNNKNKVLIMETKGFIGSEMLFKGSAAVDIVNSTAPHKSVNIVNGIKLYKFN